ncbi:hypothetical protein [Kluyvera ascorbata]|uniref:hypothetical protein n=1 Tax=Kluyvera ascorbata TaxID=51288 RepID=UPI00356424E3
MDDMQKNELQKKCTIDETRAAKQYAKKFGKKIMITNKFVVMMTDSLAYTLSVLKKRQKDLNTWGQAEQKEFEEIMGVSLKNDIEHTYYICDMGNINTYHRPAVEKTSVYEFMKKSVDRMCYIVEQLHVDSNPVEVSLVDPCSKELGPVPDKSVFKYGNFVNRTFTSEYSAFVKRDATCICPPDKYKEQLEINIGYNFCSKKMMGPDSKVSTLCHEISHFYRVESKNEMPVSENNEKKSRGTWGGVGTDDLPNDGDYKHTEDADGENIYIKYRKDLKERHSLDVFKNAYNFELYFELCVELNDNE